jgi:hypothetical protein
MTLPFQPESQERITARWRAAFSPIYDLRCSAPELKVRPGLLRRHVFDFDNGMRLIASRELLDEGIFDHVSLSGPAGPVTLSAQAFAKNGFKVVNRTLKAVHLLRPSISDTGTDGNHRIEAFEAYVGKK